MRMWGERYPAESPPPNWETRGYGSRRAQGRHRESRILHHAVVDLAEAQREDVQRVVLVEPPRPLRALLGQFRDRALHVAGGKIQRRQFGDGRIGVTRHALLETMPVHVVDEAT